MTDVAAAPELFSIQKMPAGGADSLPVPAPGTPYFVAGKNKTYVHRTGHWGRVLVPVTELPYNNLEQTGFLWYGEAPPIPAGLIGQIWSFFKAVYQELGTEAMVYLTFKNGQYGVFVPPQICSGGHVNAQFHVEHATKNGGSVVGTIHSHCNFGAFHSGTDTHDADGMDGLHMTIGKVLHDKPEYAVMLSANKIKWNLNLDEVTNGTPNLVQHPLWWHRYVAKDVTTPATQSRQHPLGWQTNWNSRNGTTRVTPATGLAPYTSPPRSTMTLPYGVFLNPTSAFLHLQTVKKMFHKDDEDVIQSCIDELEDALMDIVQELEVYGIEADVTYRTHVPDVLTSAKFPISLHHLDAVAEDLGIKNFGYASQTIKRGVHVLNGSD